MGDPSKPQGSSQPGQPVACVLPEWVSPQRGEKFSPNLHRWLKHRNNWRLAQRVYRDRDGTLWIGWFDEEDWFYGARLFEVLGFGAQTTTGAYPNLRRQLQEIEDFWPQYQAVGRCAIDPDHKVLFIDDHLRWHAVGDSRTCTWCNNARQVLSRGTLQIGGAEVAFEAWVQNNLK